MRLTSIDLLGQEKLIYFARMSDLLVGGRFQASVGLHHSKRLVEAPVIQEPRNTVVPIPRPPHHHILRVVVT